MQRLRPRADDDQGFTLIELLVVVIIIGILAAIAIPVYLNQRESARNAAVKSDLRNAATAQVAYQTQFETFTGDLPTLADHVKFGPSQGVSFTQLEYKGQERFCMVAHHTANGDDAQDWMFDSDDPRPVTAASDDACTGLDTWE